MVCTNVFLFSFNAFHTPFLLLLILSKDSGQTIYLVFVAFMCTFTAGSKVGHDSSSYLELGHVDVSTCRDIDLASPALATSWICFSVVPSTTSRPRL